LHPSFLAPAFVGAFEAIMTAKPATKTNEAFKAFIVSLPY
jgi:hypothetical protein